MEIGRTRSFLLDRGIVYFYTVFMAGYFLLPMASGHRKLYYLLVLPAIVCLWRELARFYRNNTLFLLICAYTAYMLLSLLWTEEYRNLRAIVAFWDAMMVISFVAVSGFIWVQYPHTSDQLVRRGVWLASAAALVSIVVWYTNNPFPESRLVPLGVMHHQNKSGAAYAIFLVLSVYLLSTSPGRNQRLLYLGTTALLGSLVVFTQSRTALAGACVGLVILLGWRAMGLALIAMLASWALVAANPQDWLERVENLSFRPGIWQQVLSDMQGHWLIGRGYLTNPEVEAYGQVFSHAHNSYLASLRDGGLLGLGLMLAMLGVASLWAARIMLQRGERLYLALLTLGMTCLFMDFDRLLVQPKEMWIYLWLPIAMVTAIYPHRQQSGQHRYRAAGRAT